MKNNIMTIFKKEISRFFLDKRLVFSIILLPGLLIYVLYSFMGSVITKEIDRVEAHKPVIYVLNLPGSIEEVFNKMNLEVLKTDETGLSEGMEKVKKKEAELVVVFPKNFDALVEAYDVKTGEAAPQIEVYYHSAREESGMAYRMVEESLGHFEENISNKFDLNKKGRESYDLAGKEEKSGGFFAGLLPMLLMIFMWSGCISVAPESIAGEKERGTIATLLITPTKRSDLAIGKILALGFISFLSGISSFAGTILSLPKLMGGMEGPMQKMSYGGEDYVMLFVVIISTVLILVSIISVISGFAKSVKEAATMASPVMVVIMIVSFLPGLLSGGKEEVALGMFFLPLYNSVLCMNEIFKFQTEPLHILVTAVSNLLFVIVLAGVLTKLFSSEKIMFSK